VGDEIGLIGAVGLDIGEYVNNGVRHSMHRVNFLEHNSQRNVCPHGKTTGDLSCKSKGSTHIVQWKENGADWTILLLILISKGPRCLR
jgi:hypothetical protein